MSTFRDSDEGVFSNYTRNYKIGREATSLSTIMSNHMHYRVCALITSYATSFLTEDRYQTLILMSAQLDTNRLVTKCAKTYETHIIV